MPLNIEIKAYCPRPEDIHLLLKNLKARFVGIDHQIDTYFKVSSGRLKLREGKIENHLIHYERSNQAGPKKSEVLLFKSDPGSSLKDILIKAVGTLVIVDKKRSIYFIDNVKFHLDEVQGLGSFVEIEAIDTEGTFSESELTKQCEHYIDMFKIPEKDLIQISYSDMLLNS